MRFVRTFLASIIVIVFLTGIVSSALCLALIEHETANLPGLEPVENIRPARISSILSSDGSSLGEFAQENRDPVSLSAIPLLVQQAFTSAEDRNFWHHNGVDPLAIARALLTDFRMRGNGRRAIGASTITQQVVKNLITGDEHSVHRKIQEALLAMRLEKQVGKQRVLELYLNQIYLGEGSYGVAAASQVYFGKPLAELDLAQAAYLAGLPKGPSNYDPIRRPDAAYARRSYVLGRMVDDGIATVQQADIARAEPLPHPSVQAMGGVADDYFGEEARREVVATMGVDSLYKDGIVVHTSMDPRLEAIAESSLRKGLCDYDHRHGWRGPVGHLSLDTSLGSPALWSAALQQIQPPKGAEEWRLAAVLGLAHDGSAVLGFDDMTNANLGLQGVQWARSSTPHGLGPVIHRVADVIHPGDVILVEESTQGVWQLEQIPLVQGALVAMETRTGRVVALAGGFSHEQGSFDRATQSLRQPGSLFKPFIYLSAFENGFDPTSPVLDSPVAIDPGGGAQLWRPGADGGLGWGMITARRALENSRNLSSVRLLYDLGLDVVGSTARKFSLYPVLPSYAAALGALEISDLRMTAAYAMIANGGYHIVPTFIDSVTTAQGNVLAHRNNNLLDQNSRIADPIAVAQLTSVLQGVVRNGTAANQLSRLHCQLQARLEQQMTTSMHGSWDFLRTLL